MIEYFETILSTASSKAIVFSVLTSSILTLLLFIVSGYRDRSRFRRENELKKLEELFKLIYSYSDTSKKYFWSIEPDGSDIVRNQKLKQEARDLLFQCDIYKDLFFPDMPIDTTQQNAEFYRIAENCEKIWIRVIQDSCDDIQVTLDATKIIATEVENLDSQLNPIKKWCTSRAKKLS